MRFLLLATLPLILLSGAGAEPWRCPACSTLAEGDACPECGLLRPPEGMAYVPASRVEIMGDTVSVDAFLIDSVPVSYRKVLPWLNRNLTSMQDLAEILVGQYDADGQFLKFTPFVVGESGQALTVPTNCFSMPVSSLTWTGAVRFLRHRGARLPRAAELAAAAGMGYVDPVDVYPVMSSYSQVLERNMGILGSLGSQAIFSYGEGSELQMWEWTLDAWGQEPGQPLRQQDPYRILLRPAGLEPGVARKDMGYFNVIFRGVIPVAPEIHSEGETS